MCSIYKVASVQEFFAHGIKESITVTISFTSFNDFYLQEIAKQSKFIPQVFFKKVDSYRFLVAFSECSTTISLNQTRFSHCAISHNHNLKWKNIKIIERKNICSLSKQWLPWQIEKINGLYVIWRRQSNYDEEINDNYSVIGS